MNSGKVALSLLAGAAIGAVLGVLFAPSKGAALRRKIHRMGEIKADVLKDKYSEYTDKIGNKYKKAKEDVVDLAYQSMNQNEEKVKTAEKN